MHRYGVRDVEKLLHLPRSTIRALIAAGFVSPARGPRSAWLFSFQDLIVLRTAQALAEAKVPQRRITKSVRELRRHLPDAMPLSGLSICAVADRVVVKEGGGRWQADSGQYLLEFEGDPADGSLSVIERNTAAEARTSAPEWFDKAVALEKEDTEAALAAYEQAIASKAEQVYRDAVRTCGSDPVLLYNLGVLLDDMERKAEAMEAYEAALRGDPGLADCHYNLALLYERLKRPKDAIRHMARYRALIGGRSN